MGGPETERGRGHVSSDDHTLLSGVGGDRGEVVRLDNWAKCDIDFQLNVTRLVPLLFVKSIHRMLMFSTVVFK